MTNEQHELVPAMSRKWKQINKFIEVFDHALAASPLASASRCDVVDFGIGKGYLTFAMHDYLRVRSGCRAQVTGVELRRRHGHPVQRRGRSGWASRACSSRRATCAAWRRRRWT